MRAELDRLRPLGAKPAKSDVRNFARWFAEHVAAGVDEILARARGEVAPDDEDDEPPEPEPISNPIGLLHTMLAEDVGEPPKGARGTAWCEGREPIGAIADRLQGRKARPAASRRGGFEPVGKAAARVTAARDPAPPPPSTADPEPELPAPDTKLHPQGAAIATVGRLLRRLVPFPRPRDVLTCARYSAPALEAQLNAVVELDLPEHERVPRLVALLVLEYGRAPT